MNWPFVKIEQIASVKGGKRLPKGHDFSSSATEHLYIRARDIGNNRITISEPVYISDYTFNKLKNYTVNKDDIVVTIVGANIGDVGYISADFDGANLTENAAKLRVDTTICNPKFLSAQLSTADAKRRFQIIAAGSAQGKLGLYKIKSFDVVLPPLRVQQKIASILSAYDDLIENNRRRIQLLEQAARLLYKEWFVSLRFPGHEHVKIVDSVPEGWGKKSISELADSIRYGYTASANPEETGPKFLRITDIVPDILDWSTVPYCEIPEDKKENYLLHEGDIVVARTGATTGYAKRIGKHCPEAVFASYLVRIRFSDQIDDCIAGIFLESDEYKKFIKSHIGGAAQPNANAKIISSATLLVPSKKIQREFREIVEPTFNQKELLQIQNEKLKQTRDLLLPRLMNGEIAVTALSEL